MAPASAGHSYYHPDYIIKSRRSVGGIVGERTVLRAAAPLPVIVVLTLLRLSFSNVCSRAVVVMNTTRRKKDSRKVDYSISKLSPGGLWQFTLSPIRDYDRTQELGLSLLGRVPMPASYPHRDTSLVYSYYPNIHIYSYVSTLAFYVLSVTMALKAGYNRLPLS